MRGFTSISLIIFVVILSILVGGIYLLNRQNLTSKNKILITKALPVPTSTPLDVKTHSLGIGWKSYKSNDYSIQNLPGYELIVVDPRPVAIAHNPDPVFEQVNEIYLKGDKKIIDIAYANNKGQLTLEDKKGLWADLENANISKIKIDGSDAIVSQGLKGVPLEEGVDGTTSDLIFIRNDKLFQIELFPDTPQNLQDLYKLLATFEFTDQMSPAPSVSCLPRPACLDSTPRCLIAEPANGWCK